MALTLLSANNASTVLSAGISASSTTLTVNTGTGGLFPSPVSGTSFFKLTLIDAATGTLTEIVHVTARTGDTMTIVRGQEGTVSRLWSANDIAANMMTAGTLSLLAQKDLTLQISNNLSEIAAAGAVAQAAARVNLGIAARFQKLTASGSFTVPAGVTTLYISGCAGGGGGGGAGGSRVGGDASGGGGGGAGQAIFKTPFNVTPGQVINITIGAYGFSGGGGAINSNGYDGGTGGNTVIGTLVTLLGGGGGRMGKGGVVVGGSDGGVGFPSGASGGGSGGTGTGGTGTGGGGAGGNTIFGGAGSGALNGNIGQSAFMYGGGGSGGAAANSAPNYVGGAGGNGAPGIVTFEW